MNETREARTAKDMAGLSHEERLAAAESALASERAARERAGAELRAVASAAAATEEARRQSEQARERAERERDEARRAWAAAETATARANSKAAAVLKANGDISLLWARSEDARIAAESSLSRAVEALREALDRCEKCGGYKPEFWCDKCRIARAVLAEVGAAPEVHVPRAEEAAEPGPRLGQPDEIEGCE